MKAEQRKDSTVTALGERASRLWHDVSARSNTASIVFWLAVILVVGLVVAWFSWSRWARNANASEWVQFGDANSLDDLRSLAKDHPGTVPAEMAQVVEARVLLRQGLEKYAARDEKDRTEARDKIKQAGELYEMLAGRMTSQPLLVQEATMGVARAKESRGDLDGALDWYRKAAGLKPDTTDLVAQAKQRSEELQDPGKKDAIKKFYDALLNAPPAAPPVAPPAPATP
jgi:tetratricopeptide (TPR) repeat protein